MIHNNYVSFLKTFNFSSYPSLASLELFLFRISSSAGWNNFILVDYCRGFGRIFKASGIWPSDCAGGIIYRLKGYLFSLDIGGTVVSIRIAIFLAIMCIWLFRVFNRSFRIGFWNLIGNCSATAGSRDWREKLKLEIFRLVFDSFCRIGHRSDSGNYFAQ